MAMTPRRLLDQVTSTVSYLRVADRADADPSLEWLPCAELVSNGERLLEVVRATAPGRGTDRDDIALSLFVQAYAFRVASTAIGSWLCSNRSHVLDVSPDNMFIALGRHRPNAVALSRLAFTDQPLAAAVFDDHLSRLVTTSHNTLANPGRQHIAERPSGERPSGQRRLGEATLWGNIAAGCASAFGAFHGAQDSIEGRATVRRAATDFFHGAPPKAQSAGRFVEFAGEQPEPGWFWERSRCCLLYQIPPADPTAEPFKCEDCSLWSSAQRQDRYALATQCSKEQNLEPDS